MRASLFGRSEYPGSCYDLVRLHLFISSLSQVASVRLSAGARLPSLCLPLSLSRDGEKDTGRSPLCPARERAPAVHRVSNSPSPIFDRRRLGWTSTESKNQTELVKVRDDAIKYNRPQASKAPTNIMKAAVSPPSLRADMKG